MSGPTPRDPTFGIFALPNANVPHQSTPAQVTVPQLAALRAMSADDIEDLLVNMMAQRRGISRDDLLREPHLDGSLRTRSIVMVALMNMVAKAVGYDLIRAGDLDDATRLRTMAGTAGVLKEALERTAKEPS